MLSISPTVEVFWHEGYKCLCALKDFHQGELIINLPQRSMAGPDRYSIEVSPGIHLDCTDSPVGAINHSCDPNAAVRNGRIIAWTCIKTGEEITIDYKRTEQKLAMPFDCKCNSENCRGRIE